MHGLAHFGPIGRATFTTWDGRNLAIYDDSVASREGLSFIKRMVHRLTATLSCLVAPWDKVHITHYEGLVPNVA
jgi:hypothetical protein